MGSRCATGRRPSRRDCRFHQRGVPPQVDLVDVQLTPPPLAGSRVREWQIDGAVGGVQRRRDRSRPGQRPIDGVGQCDPVRLHQLDRAARLWIRVRATADHEECGRAWMPGLQCRLGDPGVVAVILDESVLERGVVAGVSENNRQQAVVRPHHPQHRHRVVDRPVRAELDPPVRGERGLAARVSDPRGTHPRQRVAHERDQFVLESAPYRRESRPTGRMRGHTPPTAARRRPGPQCVWLALNRRFARAMPCRRWTSVATRSVMRRVTPRRSTVTSTAAGRRSTACRASALACSGSATPCDACLRSAKPAIQRERSGVMSTVAVPASRENVLGRPPHRVTARRRHRPRRQRTHAGSRSS